MAIEIQKQFKESSQSLVRRFSQRIQRSGILRRARKIRHKTREKSKQLKRRGALRREEVKREYERSKKLQ